MPHFNAITIRTSFGEGDQVIVIYDLDCSGSIGKVPASAFMTFKNGMIIKNELFHDTSPWARLREKLSA